MSYVSGRLLKTAKLKAANDIPFYKIFNLKKGAQDQQITCPFAKARHANGDRRKSAKFYVRSNTIICFTESLSWRPVSLFVELSGKSALEVADALLRKFPDGSNARTMNHIRCMSNDLTDGPKELEWEAVISMLPVGNRDCPLMFRESEFLYPGLDLLPMATRFARDMSLFLEESKHGSNI